jgi:hypothetical protein
MYPQLWLPRMCSESGSTVANRLLNAKHEHRLLFRAYHAETPTVNRNHSESRTRTITRTIETANR